MYIPMYALTQMCTYVHSDMYTHLITTLCSLLPLRYFANIPQLNLIKDRAENDEDDEPSA